MERRSVLFVCVHNSGRSQIAEAFLKEMAGDRFDVTSAGLEPGRLNPIVIEVMKEAGIDISANETKSVEDVLKTGRDFDYVISVCDETQAERCPVFPGGGKRLHWGFPDPAGFTGPQEDKLVRTRAVRDAIREKIEEWLARGD